MTRILITGAGSFIGTNYIRFSSFSDIQEVCVRSASAEMIDFNGIDVVIHVAAIVHQSQRIRREVYYRINRELPVKIAAEAKKAGVKQFVFMSTIKVYSNYSPGTSPWTEESDCFPLDHYGKSKYEAEQELRKLETPDFIVSVIRTPLVYGPGVKANFLQLTKLIEKSLILPFAGINNNRHFTYIENLVGFIDRIIETKSSGTFIAMDPSGVSISELVLKLAQELNPDLINLRLPKSLLNLISRCMPGITERLFGSFFLDNTKTRTDLNYEPPYTSEEGIKRFCDYYIGLKTN